MTKFAVPAAVVAVVVITLGTALYIQNNAPAVAAVPPAPDIAPADTLPQPIPAKPGVTPHETVTAAVGTSPTARTIAASGITRTEATVNGAITPHEVPTHFWFEYGKTTGLGNATPLTAIGDGTDPLPVSFTLANLDPITTYYFRIDAQNRFGTVNGPTMSFTTAGPSHAAPSVATDIAADISASAALLRGTINPNGTPTSYWFEYSSDSLLGVTLLKSTARVSAGSGTNPISANARISDLARRTTYYFRLVAENDAGIMRGARRSFKTK